MRAPGLYDITASLCGEKTIMRTQTEPSTRETTQVGFERSDHEVLSFPVGRVDVWRVHLHPAENVAGDGGGRSLSTATALSADEIARANRFHFQKDRLRFSRSRSVLRHLIANYSGIPAAEVIFDYLPNGKPQLAAAQNPRGLQFNVSHSAGIALIAFGCGCRLGIDVEKIRLEVDAIALAKRFFSARELAGLEALPQQLLADAFFACWTRKESFLKAIGIGLSFPLDDFSVTTEPDLDPVLEEIKGDREAGKRWQLANIEAGEGYRATVATDGVHSDVIVRDYKSNI